MSKRMLADVLWEAANVWLDPVNSMWCADGRSSSFACHAIEMALTGGKLPKEFTKDEHGQGPVWDHVRRMGVECSYDVLWPFGSDATAKQGVRYMWLLLAMHVAADEGITV